MTLDEFAEKYIFPAANARYHVSARSEFIPRIAPTELDPLRKVMMRGSYDENARKPAVCPDMRDYSPRV